MRQSFWHNGQILQEGNYFQYILTSQKRDMTALKLVWPVNTIGHRSKIIWALVYTRMDIFFRPKNKTFSYLGWPSVLTELFIANLTESNILIMVIGTEMKYMHR